VKPSLSVIIPVFNDPHGLSETLDSLLNQEPDSPPYEIIVCDNLSSDDTIDTAKEFVRKNPGMVKLVFENEIRSSYAARNRGISSADGDVLIFIDADVTVSSDFLKNIYNVMIDKKIDIAGYNVDIVVKKKSIVSLYDKINDFKIRESIQDKHFISTNCLVIRKGVFLEAGFFDARLISAGDREFGRRVSDMGYKLHYIGNISVMHPAKENLKGLCKRYFRLGRGIFDLNHYYPGTGPVKEKELSLKYIFSLKPVAFVRKMLGKRNIINFPFIYAVFFLFIKWILRIAKLSGYYYAKNHNIEVRK
jgi:glycosyltransferase AglI